MPRKKKNEVVADYDENGKLITAVDSYLAPIRKFDL